MLKLSKAIEDMKKKAADKRQVENIISLYKNGASLELMSKSFNMTIEDVKDILVKNNVELRMA